MTHQTPLSRGHQLTSGRGIEEEKSCHWFGLQPASHLAGEVSLINLGRILPGSTRFLHENGSLWRSFASDETELVSLQNLLTTWNSSKSTGLEESQKNSQSCSSCCCLTYTSLPSSYDNRGSSVRSHCFLGKGVPMRLDLLRNKSGSDSTEGVIDKQGLRAC